MSRLSSLASSLVPLLVVAAVGGAADQQIRGKKLLVKNTAVTETRRLVVALGRERPTSIAESRSRARA